MIRSQIQKRAVHAYTINCIVVNNYNFRDHLGIEVGRQLLFLQSKHWIWFCLGHLTEHLAEHSVV